MEAGRRNRRITIQRKAAAPLDQYGHPTPGREAWEDVATVWAEVLETTARERLVSAQVVAARAATVRILYRPDVDSHMRVLYKGMRWAIKSVTELGFREALEMTIEAVEVNA